MFEQMEISEQAYEGQTPSKKIIREDANREKHVSKIKGGEFASPTNPEKGHTGKRKTNNVVSMSKKTTGETNKCLLHGPVHSSEYCKVLKLYSKKYAKKRPQKENEALSDGKTKHGKSAKFNGDVN